MFLSDQETHIDYICYKPIATTATNLIKSSSDVPVTIGIHGDWGAGKSSVLKMIQAELDQEDGVACLWFNGWLFQGFDDAKTVVMESIIDELIRHKNFPAKLRDNAKDLIKRINWLKLAKTGALTAAGVAITAHTGIPTPLIGDWFFKFLEKGSLDINNLSKEDVEGIFAKAPQFIKDPEPYKIPELIHDIRDEFQKLLKDAKIKQLVVLIDDLDRCLPETAISTLEAIRLFLFVPGTIFVIGADEAMIEYSVRNHFPNLSSESVSNLYTRNYLEKLIQVPFRLPSLGLEETRVYILLLLIQSLVGPEDVEFQKLLEQASLSLNKPWINTDINLDEFIKKHTDKSEDVKAIETLSKQIGFMLAEGTNGNPRQLKRFLNTMILRRSIADARGFGEEINQAILTKLMLAERFNSQLYNLIIEEGRTSDKGSSNIISLFESKDAETLINEDDNKNYKEIYDQDWVKSWCDILPNLNGVDLRPYIFISQDKRANFQGLSLDQELADLLAFLQDASSPLALTAKEAEVKSLTTEKASTIFFLLKENIERNNAYSSKPSGLEGLRLIAKHHEHLKQEIITFIKNIPVNSFEVWVLSGWESSLGADLNQELLTYFSKQTENSQIQKAAQGILSSLQKA